MNFGFPLAWRKGLVLSATFLLSLFLVISCRKKENLIGQNQIDQNSLLESGGVDTFSMQTFSYMPDSVISDNAPFALLGYYDDPEFGTFNAEFYTQFRLSGFDPDFGDLSTIVVDSFVIALEYIGQYGASGTHTIEVHELTEDLHIDSVYYSHTTKNVDNTFGSNNGDLVKNGYSQYALDKYYPTTVGEDTLIASQLRIHLSVAKAKQMIEDAMSGNGFYSDNEAFADYFKGVRIKTIPSQLSGEGGIFYFNLGDNDSKMTIYYQQDGEQKEYDFLMNSYSADFNHIDIVNSYKIQQVIADTISGQQEFYAQAFGARGVLKIPGLSNIPKNAIIHKAILELPVAYHTYSKYTPSLDLSVTTILEDGATQLYALDVVGTYNNYSKSYVMDIRTYVQAVVNQEVENTQLIFSPALYNTTAERIIFNGKESSNKMKPTFYILYTEF